ncbi:hypothetical protein ACFPT7_15405 [Acidicapsa dinghuensis]|uniref:Peptidase M1 membrane alanine aminopeptidase domain-containing protein n=1 Tax=Acidicapsa dinghuensis TaxID=2218256 RepID=A0ABW1EJV8_9BACT|nr:hypothetical protein [Acidicapsa dinghuensis]
MKANTLQRIGMALLFGGSLCAGISLSAAAQTSTGAPPVSSQSIQDTQKNQDKKDKIVFQRSIDADGQVVDGPGAQGNSDNPAAALQNQSGISPAKPSAAVLSAEDAERSAIAFTDYDMDVRLRPAESHIAVRTLVSVRNTGKTPLQHLRLQIGSELNWESIRINSQPMPFAAAVLNSDADHTGQLHEAAVTLATPLAPGAEVQVDVTYSGAIKQSLKRLLAIGTPEEVAETSDWDRISTDFTGLRGFGSVVWYPVSSVPVILGDGNRLFDEIGQHKLQLSGAHLRLALTVESPAAQAPDIALVNGHPVTLTSSSSADPSLPVISTGRIEETTIGFEALSLFLARRNHHASGDIDLWTRIDTESNVTSWSTAANDVTPFLQGWLGKSPRTRLTVLDLPDDGDIPFETGSMLATPVRSASEDVLNGVMAHALSHAWVNSRRAWLSEGVAHFMGTLWVEKKLGRNRALAALDNSREALTLIEPESPGESDGEPLISCISPAYYRTKATYVFWMLRELVGDETLSAAFRAYDPAKDTAPDAFEKLIEQAGPRHDLSWFFNDWVYHDRGLPDLSIGEVYPTPASVGGSYLVAVDVANNGYAAVEAPLQVITADTSITQHIMLAARSKIVQRILIQGKPTEVRLNDGTIPETQATVHAKTLTDAPAKP